MLTNLWWQRFVGTAQKHWVCPGRVDGRRVELTRTVEACKLAGPTDRRTDGRTNERTNGRTNERTGPMGSPGGRRNRPSLLSIEEAVERTEQSKGRDHSLAAVRAVASVRSPSTGPSGRHVLVSVPLDTLGEDARCDGTFTLSVACGLGLGGPPFRTLRCGSLTAQRC